MDCQIAVEIDGKYVYKTPVDLIDSLCWEYIKAHGLYDKGFLPNGDGWLKESHKFIQAMMLLDSEFKKLKSKKE